jgi:hypothetical protein
MNPYLNLTNETKMFRKNQICYMLVSLLLVPALQSQELKTAWLTDLFRSKAYIISKPEYTHISLLKPHQQH